MADMSNPFSTRRVRPGQLAFQFADPRGAAPFVERLERMGWWGQIVGPHGVGKSTLVHALVPYLESAERNLIWFTLRAGQRRLPTERFTWESLRRSNRALVIVDGYEQLGWPARYFLKRHCRASQAGLLVTTHKDAGLPPLVELRCSIEVVHHLVDQLLHNSPPTITRDDVSRACDMCRGNVRDVFFALYDLYELRRHEPECMPVLPCSSI